MTTDDSVPQCEAGLGLPCLCGYADDTCPHRVPPRIGGQRGRFEDIENTLTLYVAHTENLIERMHEMEEFVTACLGWHRCEGGPATKIADTAARCPGCDFTFSTLMDEPVTPPHWVSRGGEVVVFPATD